jgi:hypothetical protein
MHISEIGSIGLRGWKGGTSIKDRDVFEQV